MLPPKSTPSLPNEQRIESSCYLGLDVGGTKIQAGVVTATGEVLETHAVRSHIGGTKDDVLADIRIALEPLRPQAVVGRAVGFPSFGDYDQGVLDSELSGYPSMHGFPLRQYLEDAYGVTTKMIADANLFAHGIRRFGEGRRFASFIAIAIGTGTAIGLVRDGQVLTGPRGFPETTMRFYTEWGWPAAWRHSGYHFAEHYGADAETTYQRALAGERSALRTFERVGAARSDTIARLSEETDIHVAVVGGGMANAWEFFAPSLQARLEESGVIASKTELQNPSLAGAAALFQR